jgi:hypothetical protein
VLEPAGFDYLDAPYAYTPYVWAARYIGLAQNIEGSPPQLSVCLLLCRCKIVAARIGLTAVSASEV